MTRARTILLGLCAATFIQLVRGAEPQAPVTDAIARIRAGREAFAKRQYPQALAEFRAAIVLQPQIKNAQFLAGVAAYWAREPKTALGYWDALLAAAPKASDEEWEIVRHRVMALWALGEDQAAEEAIGRLYELRRVHKVAGALAARGFTREHMWVGQQRAGVWEVFDEKGEQAHVWEFPVTDAQRPDGALLKRLAVEVEARAEGGTGYHLTEEGAKYRKVYARWMAKPPYREVRVLVAEALEGKLKAIDTAPADDDGRFAAPAAAGADRTPRVFTPAEQARMERAAPPNLPSGVANILRTAARLAEVDFDVTRLIRNSLTDTALAKRMEEEELKGKHPWAKHDAADMVQQLTQAKATDVDGVMANLNAVLGDAKGDYVRFVLLTGINSREGAIPEAFVVDCLGAKDFVVRETAALILGRSGSRRGLDALFGELQLADALGARILSYPLEELLGNALGQTPTGDEKSTTVWREAALAWWKEHGARLSFQKESAQWK